MAALAIPQHNLHHKEVTGAMANPEVGQAVAVEAQAQQVEILLLVLLVLVVLVHPTPSQVHR
jgi:hypothetical protein